MEQPVIELTQCVKLCYSTIGSLKYHRCCNKHRFMMAAFTANFTLAPLKTNPITAGKKEEDNSLRTLVQLSETVGVSENIVISSSSSTKAKDLSCQGASRNNCN